MADMNIELLKFNYFLKQLADPAAKASVVNDQLCLSKVSPAVGTLEERMIKIISYISAHGDLVNSRNLKWIKEIKARCVADSASQGAEIQKKIHAQFDKFESLLNPVTEKIDKPSSRECICLQVSAPPKNKQAFIENLQLLLNNFPRYQLHQDLSIYDSAYKSLSQDWNFDRMYEALEIEFNKYAQIEPDEALIALKSSIYSLLKFPIPIKMGVIIETSPIGTDNESMLVNMMNLVQQRIPCLINRHFFCAHAKNFDNWPKFNLKDYDIYIQKNGDLCAVIAKGSSLSSQGFHEDSFKLADSEEYLKPSARPLKFHKDIRTLLVNETEKQRFFRIVSFWGHGTYPGYPGDLNSKKTGIIAGLPEMCFRKSLTSLKEKNMAFMHLMSCYSGGTLSTRIHLGDKTVPCPVYIQSSFDVSTVIHTDLQSEYDSVRLLQVANNILFPSLRKGSPLTTYPLSLTAADRKRLSSLYEYSYTIRHFTNIGALLMPSNRKDIPKVVYPAVEDKEILDVSRAFNKLKASCHSEHWPTALEDSSLERKAYLFSEPIVPFILKVSATLPMILLSRGGATHHLIKGIVASKHHLEDIAKETFNAFENIFSFDTDLDQFVTKVYFIGDFSCQYQGKSVTLSRVVIKQSLRQCEVFFQPERETDFTKLVYKRQAVAGYSWRQDKVEKISHNAGIRTIYQMAFSSSPGNKALYHITAGRQSHEDFIEALDSFFFMGRPSIAAKIYSAILKDKYAYPSKTFHLKGTLIELKAELYSMPIKDKYEIFCSAFDMPQISFSNQILLRDFTYTPLMFAVKDGDLEKVKSLLKENPETLEAVHMNGSTALTVAIFEKKTDIAQWLIEQGANINHVNRFGYSPIFYACYTSIEFIEWLLNKNVPVRGKQGAEMLMEMIKTKDWIKSEFFIDHEFGAETSQYPFLGEALKHGAKMTIIKKLLRYPHVRINEQFTDNKTTVLHQCVYVQDIETMKFCLERGADPNITNKNKESPLFWLGMYGKDQIVEFAQTLIEAGANVNEQDASGKTPLYNAILSCQKPLIEILIRRGASLQIEDKDNINVLEYAAGMDMLDFILQIPGIDINPKYCKLDLLFQNAIQAGKLETAKWLVMHGVDINGKFNLSAYLHTYLSQLPVGGDPKPGVQFFIDRGADLGQQNNEGDAIMHLVMRRHDIELFKFLKTAGVSVDLPLNHKGESPFSAAFNTQPLKNSKYLERILEAEEETILNKDIAALLKKSLENSEGYPLAAILLVDMVIQVHLARGDGVKNPTLLLYQAISDQIVDDVEKWFKEHPKTKPKDFYGLPVLHAALYFTGRINAENRKKGNEIIQTILKNFPESVHDKYIKLPTQLAEDFEVIKTLILMDAEIDVGSVNPGLKMIDLEILDMLEKKGVDLSGKTGLSYLKLYIYHNCLVGIKHMLPKIKMSPHFILGLAIIDQKSDEILDLLIACPFLEVHHLSEYGSLLTYALFKKNTRIVKWLLSKKAPFFYKKGQHTYPSPFHVLSLLKESEEVKSMADDLLQSEYINTLNHVCTLEAGTPLFHAIKLKHEILINFLIEHGADVNKSNSQGISPLHLALMSKLIPTAIALIKKGAEVNAVDDKGNTPLHKALLHLGSTQKEKKILELITLMFGKGARWDMPNKEGLTAKDLAVKLRLRKVLELM